MLRTSITLPNPLHQRLRMAARAENKSVSDLARDLLEQALLAQEQTRMNRVYRMLEEVKGICKDNIPDASQNINSVLYGENGAWKGEHGK